MKNLSLFIKNNIKNLIIILVILIVFIIGIIYYFIHEDKPETKQRINISEFPNILEIDKEGKLLSYPEVTILAETDGKIVNLYATEGDIVDEWQTVMQIGNENNEEEIINTVERQIGLKYSEFYENMDKYNEFQTQYGSKISDLEKKLLEDNTALKIASETNDTKTIDKLQNEIQELNQKLTILKMKRDKLKNNISNLENEINSSNRESVNLYYEMDKQTPRATIPGIIGNIYVQEGDEVSNGDKLFTIIDNTYSPEISVGMNFNEYLLTKDLTGVQIITENENRGNSYFEGEIYTRSPILNNEGEYTITVRILEEVSDLILSDKNTKITVVFTKEFPTIWIPNNCFTELGKNSGKLTLRDGEVITGKEVGIKNKWENWINVDNLALFGLEKEEEKDGIDLCVEDWNKGIIKENDVDIIDWYNQFETVEDFCGEFIKVNPMYLSGHRNLAIVSELGGNGEIIEVLCDIE